MEGILCIKSKMGVLKSINRAIMNPLVSIIVILSFATLGLCDNQKRAVYVENAAVNTGVVIAPGVSSHNSYTHADVASKHQSVALTPSAAYGYAYGSGLNYGPAYGYGSNFGAYKGVHYDVGGVHREENYGHGVVHPAGGFSPTAHGVNYVGAQGGVILTNGVAHHPQVVQAHPVYTVPITSGHETVHVPVNQHYVPVDQHHPVNQHYVPVDQHHPVNQHYVPVDQHQPVQVFVPHQAVSSGHVLNSASTVSASGLSLEHSHVHVPTSQGPVYYAGQNGFNSGWVSQGQLHASSIPQQGWVH